MRNWSFGLVIALSLGIGLATPQLAAADTTSDARKSIEIALAKMRVALSKKDVAAYTQFYAEDFVMVRRNGQKITKPQAIAMMTQLLQQTKSVKVTGKIEKFIYNKDKVTLNVLENGIMLLANPKGGQDAKLAMTSLEESIWVRNANGWKIKQTKTLTSKALVNGKPIPQQ